MSESKSAQPFGHYFSAAKELKLKNLTVELAGKELELFSAEGIFSSQGLDKATDILLRNLDKLPNIPHNAEILDLGCGWGPISITAALNHPHARITAVDVNEHARTITELNAQKHQLKIEVYAPEAVDPELKFDAIWSNPPIRIGKVRLHEMLTFWLNRLNQGGHAALVVGKNLGSDSLANWIQIQFPSFRVEKVHSSKGFRILVVSKD